MKKILLLTLSALILALSSCKEEVPVPKVSVTAGEATETTLSFTVTPENAQSGAYLCVEGSQEISAAADIIANGVKFDVSNASTQTITDLKKGTEYTIMVAVNAGPHNVAATPLKMKTLDAVVPTITIEEGESFATSLTFIANTANATKAAYTIYTEGETPSAEDIIANGTEFNVGENVTVSIANLVAGTNYIIVAAATDGQVSVASEELEMTTTAGGSTDGITEVTGRKWNRYNYGLNIYNNENCYAFLNIYLDTHAPGGVLPEGTYPVMEYTGELDPNSGEPITPVESSFIWDMGSLMTFDDQYYNTGNYTAPKSGFVKVSHLNNGYKIEVDITDTDGYNMKGTYEGIVVGTFEQEGFSNPPIPWDDKTISGTFSSVKGANFGDEGGFYLWMVTEEEAYDIFLILRNPIVDDGLIPEGTYTVGYFDPENPNALVIDGTEEQIHAQRPEEQYRYIIEGGTLTVTHSVGAYILDLNIENELKTKFDISWEGAITNQWDGGNDFVNPQGPSTSYEWGTIEGKYYNENNFTIRATTTDGQTSIYMDLYCPTSYYNIIPEGEYKVADYSEPITTPFVDSYSYVTFEHGGAEVYFTDGYAKVEHLKEGYDIRVNVTLSNGETFKTNLTGVFEDKDGSGFANPPIPGGEENNCVVVGSTGWSKTQYTVIFKEGSKEKLNLNVNCVSSVCNIIPEGEYIVENNVTWENPSQYDYYINGAQSYAGSSNVNSGVMVVEHLESGYKITFNGTDAAGNEYDYSFMGTMDPVDKWSTIGNPPVPYNETTVDTEIISLSGNHTGPGEIFYLTAMLADQPYDLYLVLEAPERVNDGIIPEGTYTIGGEYGLSRESWANDGEWEVGFTENSSVKVTHLSEGYGIELALETELLTKVNATRNGLIFKSDDAQFPFQNPGYEYEPYYDIVFTEGAPAGTYTTYNAGLEFKKYMFQNSNGDYMEMVFDIETATPYLQAGTYLPCDEFNPANPYGPFTFYGNGCPLTVSGSGQQYPYYLQSGTIEVEIENGIYTIVMKSYAWIDGQQLVRVTYTGDLEGIAGEGGNEGGEEEGDYITLSSCEFLGDLMGYGMLNQFVAKSSDNNHVIYFSLSQLPGMSKESYIASGDYTLVSANTIAYNPTSYYFNMSLLDEDQLHVIDGESYYVIEDNSGSTMNVVSEGDGANHVITLVVNKGGNTYNYRFNGTIQ